VLSLTALSCKAPVVRTVAPASAPPFVPVTRPEIEIDPTTADEISVTDPPADPFSQPTVHANTSGSTSSPSLPVRSTSLEFVICTIVPPTVTISTDRARSTIKRAKFPHQNRAGFRRPSAATFSAQSALRIRPGNRGEGWAIETT